jgi:hypothetical protein
MQRFSGGVVSLEWLDRPTGSALGSQTPLDAAKPRPVSGEALATTERGGFFGRARRRALVMPRRERKRRPLNLLSLVTTGLMRPCRDYHCSPCEPRSQPLFLTHSDPHARLTLLMEVSSFFHVVGCDGPKFRESPPFQVRGVSLCPRWGVPSPSCPSVVAGPPPGIERKGYDQNMGPLSAVAVAVSFLILGMNWIAWITASAHTLGVILIIAAIVVLIDAFWHARGYFPRRTPPA